MATHVEVFGTEFTISHRQYRRRSSTAIARSKALWEALYLKQAFPGPPEVRLIYGPLASSSVLDSLLTHAPKCLGGN
jgi:hypothetical protein